MLTGSAAIVDTMYVYIASNIFMNCKVLDSHSGDSEEFYLLFST
jgi:hypothetical protein